MNNRMIKSLRQGLQHSKRSLARAEQAGHDLEQFQEQVTYYEHELLKAGSDLVQRITRPELSIMFADTLFEVEGIEYTKALEYIAGLSDNDLESKANTQYRGTGTFYKMTVS